MSAKKNHAAQRINGQLSILLPISTHKDTPPTAPPRQSLPSASQSGETRQTVGESARDILIRQLEKSGF